MRQITNIKDNLLLKNCTLCRTICQRFENIDDLHSNARQKTGIKTNEKGKKMTGQTIFYQNCLSCHPAIIEPVKAAVGANASSANASTAQSQEDYFKKYKALCIDISTARSLC